MVSHLVLQMQKKTGSLSILPLDFLVSIFQLCVEVVDLRDLVLKLGLELLQVVGQL
jgi:hypothetical protein